jgi:hypothetical protein
VRLLFRFRFIPAGLFADDVQAFVDEFNRLFNADGEDYLMTVSDQLLAQNRIMLLQAVAEAIRLYTLTNGYKAIINARLNLQGDHDKRLLKYLQLAKELTGIEIKTMDDIVAYNNEVQRKIDKYNEKYSKPKPTKTTTILELFTAACRVMEVTHDYTKMTLWEFAQFKRQAEEHARRLEAIYKDHGRD